MVDFVPGMQVRVLDCYPYSPRDHNLCGAVGTVLGSDDDWCCVSFDGFAGHSGSRWNIPKQFLSPADDNTFWMVFGEGAGAPTYKHNTEVGARTEANRLATLNSGRRFFVLEAVGVAELPKTKPTYQSFHAYPVVTHSSKNPEDQQ
jgi:hypothetical protein